MSRRTDTIPPAYFETLYQSNPDPWDFAGSPYEQQKYAQSLAALPDRRYANALEIGCSIGIFTRMLSARCDHVVAIDAAESALVQARANCAGLPVRFEKLTIPGDWPQGRYDLIVLSEILYYLSAPDVEKTADLARAALLEGGAILMVHFLGVTDYPLTGDEAASIFLSASGMRPRHSLRAPLYRIDTLEACH
jgi:2-polyprenyl-3-methyl-5-hydroxy-6-metoxy-1,4-benzoquinol methylase